MTDRAKKIIFEILIFSGLFALIFCGLNAWVDGKIDSHYELFYRELSNKKDPSPIILLGASKASEGVNPKALEAEGLNAFNFGTDNSDPYFYTKWYNELFKTHYPRPKIIIYCVDWVMFENKGRWIEHDSQYFPLGYYWRQVFNPKLNRKLLISNRYPLFKYRGFFFKLIRNRYSYYPWLMDKAYKGYVPVDGTGELRKTFVDTIDHIRPEYMECLLKLLDQWKSEGISVIFAQTPDYIPGRESEHLERNQKILHDIADSRGIPYLDYNGGLASPLNYEKKYFRDWTHLNLEGSNVFSPIFAKDLRKIIDKMKWQ